MRIVHLDTLTLTIADRQTTFWDAVARGDWEPLTLATIRAYCRPGVVFVDCGAWIGPTTLVAAGAGAQVFAIEADPVALEQLAANLAANPELARRITVLPRALSPDEGLVRMGSRRKPGNSFSSLLHADAGAHWMIEAITPAELARIIGPASSLLTKIDIEGSEYAVVPALVPYLDRAESGVQLSFHPKLLTEIRGADEVGRATQAVLQSFTGWTTYCAGECTWTPVKDPLSPGSCAQAADHATDWLFLRGCELRTRC